MKLGKRSKDEEPGDAAQAAAEEAGAAGDSWTAADDRAATPEPPTETWTPADERAAAADPEPVVEGEAVELTDAAPSPEPAARPVPLTIHEPPPDPPAPAANPIVDVSGAPSSTAPSYDGHAAEPSADPLEPVKALAAARPEVVVGAAFAGGVLAAMILRRLGN